VQRLCDGCWPMCVRSSRQFDMKTSRWRGPRASGSTSRSMAVRTPGKMRWRCIASCPGGYRSLRPGTRSSVASIDWNKPSRTFPGRTT